MMFANNEEKRSVYRKRQRRGMQDLRFMMLLFMILIILYVAFGYLTLNQLQTLPENFLRNYILICAVSIIVWFIPIRMLWNFNRLGRILFFLCTIASLYIAKDILILYDMSVEPVFYKYMFLVLFLCKCIGMIICCLQLAFSYTIHSIWSVDDMFDDELQELENIPIYEDETTNTSPWESKALRMMRRFSIKLAFSLYGSLICIIFIFTFLKTLLPSVYESMEAIQLPLFSECLFTGMVWSIPVIALYIGKRWSFYLIYVAVLVELLSFLLRLSSIENLFFMRIQENSVRILYIVIEVLRYLLIFVICKRFLRSRLLMEYQHHKFADK